MIVVMRCWTGHAMFAFQETQKVPITRLFTNLQQRLALDTNSFEVTYRLARLHSMAYATELAEFDATKREGDPVFGFAGSDGGVPAKVQLPASGPSRRSALLHLTNAITLYQRAIPLLRKGTNEQTLRWYVLPTHLGLAWCWDQSGNRSEALSGYRKALRLAWKIEVTGDYTVKDLMQDVWNDVRAGQNPIHARHHGFLGPGVCFSDEIISYLLKLLDPVNDAREIADLNARQKTLQSMPRAITPIVVPLETDLPLNALVNTEANVPFDLDGSGLCRRWGWITSKSAWLVYDADGSGQISSGLQMFGAVTFWMFWSDGYETLAALDDDGDGLLRGGELAHLALWQDRNGNGLSEPGEVQPLAAFGIIAVACFGDGQELGCLRNSQGVFFEDGSSRPTYDWIAPESNPSTDSSE